MSGDVDFLTKYRAWLEAHLTDIVPPTPEAVETWYAEAHPPRLTAEDVWNGLRPHGWGRLDVQEPRIRALCAEVADLRNAAREDDEEAWIEDALERMFGICNKGEFSRPYVNSAIRAAYRARKTR